MDDRLARLEQKLGQAQEDVAEFRRDLANKIDQSFRWSIVTMGVGLIITWLGAFFLLAKGASLLRRFLIQ